ncbi:unnamed protein product [Lymnaea stagnalis]|uniref:F-box domain-containing protein n=1 Tax=Lymnaea stagnalis TaxID=6523 RepID=A0AAV2H6V6_LYMST
MATSPEEYADFQAHILNSVKHYRDIQKKEGDVSPIAECLIRLEGHEVIDFSSQYGSESSISYVAYNLAGKACVFPSYGDYTQACVFRTYGPWWNIAPSGRIKYRGTPSEFASEDFIEISFAEYLYPVRIEVYETYNPGAIVRILACDRAGGTDADKGQITWVTLWRGQPKPCKQRPRIFAPHLKKINFATNLIRLELNHHHLDYYTELDGIKLIGTKTPPCSDFYIHQPVLSVDDADPDITFEFCERDEGFRKGDHQQETSQDNQSIITNNQENLSSEVQLSNSMAYVFIDAEESSFFTLLPKEIVHLILSYLDLQDLCRLAQTCSHMKAHCYDPYLYTDLNLQPFWTQVSSSSMLLMIPKCLRIQRLNLSWLGKGGHMFLAHLITFFENCCQELGTLELCCCNFVDSSVLKSVASICCNLLDLNLLGCTNIDDFSCLRILSLPKLRKLNLYRTKIDYSSLMAVIRSSPDLEHLNIGSCQLLNSYINAILMELGSFCKKLKSLDLWRMKALSDEGLDYLYNNCHELQELDVGWCVELKSDKDCYLNLAKNCKNLRKLFLTANRTVRDVDLRAIALNCPFMEQLDILGTREVTKDAIVHVLETCKNLIFLDVSFCLGISPSDVCSWRASYPHVSIKKSFQNISIT